MSALLRILAWTLALALVALPVVAVVNGWIGAERWPLSKLRVQGELARVQPAQLQAAVLRTRLPMLSRWTARRRALAATYRRLLTGVVRPLPCS